MAQSIGDLDVSKTFSNVLLSNVNVRDGIDSLGMPVNLDTEVRRSNARVQDGLGTACPLLISQTNIAVDIAPQTVDSVVRLSEMLDTVTQAQNNYLILG